MPAQTRARARTEARTHPHPPTRPSRPTRTQNGPTDAHAQPNAPTATRGVARRLHARGPTIDAKMVAKLRPRA
eukprot:6188721-Pleurochrysis_carterae.AAC.2